MSAAVYVVAGMLASAVLVGVWKLGAPWDMLLAFGLAIAAYLFGYRSATADNQ